MSETLKHVVIYTDGGAVPNPGRGGYGVVLRFGKHKRELSDGYRLTTNNRMELMAVIAGLETLKERCRVTLHSDSQYIVNAINSGSAFRWRENRWRMSRGGSQRVKNPDLWKRLLEAYERHQVKMVWVKGHAGIEDNERCDVLAMEAMNQPGLQPDMGYEESVVGGATNSDSAHVDAANAGAEHLKTAPSESADGESSSSSAEPRRELFHREKITFEGQPCRKCGTAVVKRVPKQRNVKPGQTYYYAWYLYCPACRTMYMLEDAKVSIRENA